MLVAIEKETQIIKIFDYLTQRFGEININLLGGEMGAVGFDLRNLPIADMQVCRAIAAEIQAELDRLELDWKAAPWWGYTFKKRRVKGAKQRMEFHFYVCLLRGDVWRENRKDGGFIEDSDPPIELIEQYA